MDHFPVRVYTVVVSMSSTEKYDTCPACTSFSFTVSGFLSGALCVWNLLCLLLICAALLWVQPVSCCLLAFVVEGWGRRGSILAGYPCFLSSSCIAGAVWCPTDLDRYCSAVAFAMFDWAGAQVGPLVAEDYFNVWNSEAVFPSSFRNSLMKDGEIG